MAVKTEPGLQARSYQKLPVREAFSISAIIFVHNDLTAMYKTQEVTNGTIL